MDETPFDDRLDRIAVLGRSGALQAEVLAELRGLVREVEAPAGGEDERKEVVERLRAAPHGT